MKIFIGLLYLSFSPLICPVTLNLEIWTDYSFSKIYLQGHNYNACLGPRICWSCGFISRSWHMYLMKFFCAIFRPQRSYNGLISYSSVTTSTSRRNIHCLIINAEQTTVLRNVWRKINLIVRSYNIKMLLLSVTEIRGDAMLKCTLVLRTMAATSVLLFTIKVEYSIRFWVQWTVFLQVRRQGVFSIKTLTIYAAYF